MDMATEHTETEQAGTAATDLRQALQPYPNVQQVSWCEIFAALWISNRHRSLMVATQYRPWKTAIPPRSCWGGLRGDPGLYSAAGGACFSSRLS